MRELNLLLLLMEVQPHTTQQRPPLRLGTMSPKPANHSSIAGMHNGLTGTVQDDLQFQFDILPRKYPDLADSTNERSKAVEEQDELMAKNTRSERDLAFANKDRDELMAKNVPLERELSYAIKEIVALKVQNKELSDDLRVQSVTLEDQKTNLSEVRAALGWSAAEVQKSEKEETNAILTAEVIEPVVPHSRRNIVPLRIPGEKTTTEENITEQIVKKNNFPGISIAEASSRFGIPSHHKAPAVAPLSFTRTEPRKPKPLGPCRDYFTAEDCPVGINCPYVHKDKSTIFCRYMGEENGCPEGDKCPFRHDFQAEQARYRQGFRPRIPNVPGPNHERNKATRAAQGAWKEKRVL